MPQSVFGSPLSRKLKGETVVAHLPNRGSDFGAASASHTTENHQSLENEDPETKAPGRRPGTVFEEMILIRSIVQFNVGNIIRVITETFFSTGNHHDFFTMILVCIIQVRNFTVQIGI